VGSKKHSAARGAQQAELPTQSTLQSSLDNGPADGITCDFEENNSPSTVFAALFREHATDHPLSNEEMLSLERLPQFYPEPCYGDEVVSLARIV
jgi:hypothetical protein